MTIGTTSKRYAKALILHAIDQGKLDMLFEEILSLSNILEESEELRDFILSLIHISEPTRPY